jgi:phosphoglycolate phosphatase
MPLDLSQATIVFDLDGTLIDTAPDLAAATNHVLGLLGLAPVTVAELRPFIGHGSRAMIAAGVKLHGTPIGEDVISSLHDRFLEYYATNVAVSSRPYEGVPELLETLRAAGALLAVCTNKIERLSRLLLRELALESQFAAIAGRDTFHVCKPAAGHLTGAIAMAGGRPDRAVMVGDSEVDFATAQAADIPAIGVTFGYATRPVRELARAMDAIIDDYRQFLPALVGVLKGQGSLPRGPTLSDPPP